MRRRLFVATAAGLLLAASTGCGGQADSPGALVRITERDFKISAPKEIAAGDIRLEVTNKGPVAHELIVVRTNSRLPLRSDAITVDEDALEPSIPGVLEPGEPGRTRTLRLRLLPGRYMLICNMAGHYLGGMHAVLRVR